MFLDLRKMLYVQPYIIFCILTRMNLIPGSSKVMDWGNLAKRILEWAERRGPEGKKATTYFLKVSLRKLKEAIVG